MAIPDSLRNAAPKSIGIRKLRESGIYAALGSATAFSILITLAIVVVLGRDTMYFFGKDEVTFTDFAFGTEWNPLLGNEKHFGIWPLISGTMLVAGIGLAVAIPMGLVTAIYLSEYAQPKVRAILKPALEILAGIPTVVYGFLALVLFTPAIKFFHDGVGSYNALSAGIAVGILITPIISSLSEDALRAVPQSLRDGAKALGGTNFDASVRVAFPAALSGIVSAILLAMARAVGETMIVALAAGSTPKMTINPVEQIQTMTGFMVQMALGDISYFSAEYFSIYAVAAVLFLITFVLTILGSIIRKRYREVYQ